MKVLEQIDEANEILETLSKKERVSIISKRNELLTAQYPNGGATQENRDNCLIQSMNFFNIAI
jgi:hypothetical protein